VTSTWRRAPSGALLIFVGDNGGDIEIEDILNLFADVPVAFRRPACPYLREVGEDLWHRLPTWARPVLCELIRLCAA
jgi:hypothetical protein